uniref:Exoribonuclease-2 n=1 Tax=Candidatus Kentrum sp. SD TaxID=2126332 RepID=A0A450YJG1_9GAMM|nr:MAG: exoribonuclease-2 [Candidatus Kentron sp. SD]VFK47492.1 MAG: exoribonuclease-2 [Candidatus Kentron sp. SD]VFK80188.1 MAG: exoribonuclease-2 [Candidatus Kentron sp. SD]
MPETFLKNSLVLYKSKPARVVAVADKLEIELDDGQTQRVRPKDVMMIHPGPVHEIRDLVARTGDVETACELIADSSVDLPELTELLYGDDSPSSRWNTWQLVADGIYFHGAPDNIWVHSAEDARKRLAEREARTARNHAWEKFLIRVRNSQPLEPRDAEYLKETEALAFARTGQSRLLRKLGIEQTPAHAHALLLRLGYWDECVNPHPARIGLDTHSPRISIQPHVFASGILSNPRRDLTHLATFAIDDEGNQDPDDAIGLDGNRLWIHVADVAAVVSPGSEADIEARNRGATLYLPELTAPMLPEKVAEEFGLGHREISPALSFGLDLDADGAILHTEVVPSRIRVQRLTYAMVEERIREKPFSRLWEIARTARERRRASGATFITLPEVDIRVIDQEIQIRVQLRLDSRALVAETMIMAGSAAARFALERDIPFPFITQAGSQNPSPPETSASDQSAATLAEMYARRRGFAPRQIRITPAPHAGLGLDCYTQVTSPLRRYLDLVAHQQLWAYLRGEKMLDAEQLMERVGATQMATAGIRKGERFSNRHWTMVYLKRHPNWRGEGILVEKTDRRGIVLIPELGLETQIRYRGDPPLNQAFTLQLGKVDLPRLSPTFMMERIPDVAGRGQM